MSEFRTDDSGEYLIISEDDRVAAVKLSESVLEDSLDDAESWIGEQGLATHVRLALDGEVVLLVSQDIHSQESRIKYILDLETGGFIVIRETLTSFDQADMPTLDPEFIRESIETMASLGQYLGTEQAWQDFMDVLRDGKTARDSLHAFYEQTGRAALRGLDDQDTSELM